MEVNSEKTFYEINVTEAFRTVDADVILWGEDLYDENNCTSRIW